MFNRIWSDNAKQAALAPEMIKDLRKQAARLVQDDLANGEEYDDLQEATENYFHWLVNNFK